MAARPCPREALLFDNWRVMHGRAAFTGRRHMCGGYVNHEDMDSRLRSGCSDERPSPAVRRWPSTRRPTMHTPIAAGRGNPTGEYDCPMILRFGARFQSISHGVYLRNTENPLQAAIGRYHPFDGDGMLHSISFENGTARYCNRFVQHPWLASRAASRTGAVGRARRTPLEVDTPDGWGARARMKYPPAPMWWYMQALPNPASTNAATSISTTRTLRDLGRDSWDGSFPTTGSVGAHKVDERSGELLFFNYSTQAPVHALWRRRPG